MVKKINMLQETKIKVTILKVSSRKVQSPWNGAGVLTISSGCRTVK
jgi:hypothetical protein